MRGGGCYGCSWGSSRRGEEQGIDVEGGREEGGVYQRRDVPGEIPRDVHEVEVVVGHIEFLWIRVTSPRQWER